MPIRAFIAVLVIAVLAACSGPTIEDEVLGEARETYAELVQGKVDSILARMPDRASGPEFATRFRNSLDNMRAIIPVGVAATTTELIGYKLQVDSAGEVAAPNYRYRYGDTVLVLETQFRRARKDGPWTLMLVNLAPAGPASAKAPAMRPAETPPPVKAP